MTRLYTTLSVYLGVEDEHLPGDVADADEGVDKVSAEFSGDVVYGVSSMSRPVDRPVAEVANIPRLLYLTIILLNLYI